MAERQKYLMYVTTSGCRVDAPLMASGAFSDQPIASAAKGLFPSRIFSILRYSSPFGPSNSNWTAATICVPKPIPWAANDIFSQAKAASKVENFDFSVTEIRITTGACKNKWRFQNRISVFTPIVLSFRVSSSVFPFPERQAFPNLETMFRQELGDITLGGPKPDHLLLTNRLLSKFSIGVPFSSISAISSKDFGTVI